MKILIYGPSGCGKTTNKDKLKQAFNCQTVIDGLCPHYEQILTQDNVLILTNVDKATAEQYKKRMGIDIVLSFNQALAQCKE